MFRRRPIPSYFRVASTNSDVNLSFESYGREHIYLQFFTNAKLSARPFYPRLLAMNLHWKKYIRRPETSDSNSHVPNVTVMGLYARLTNNTRTCSMTTPVPCHLKHLLGTRTGKWESQACGTVLLLQTEVASKRTRIKKRHWTKTCIK